MTIPVVSRDPLFDQERILGVRRRWKRPIHAQIGSEGGDEYSLAPLRDAVVRRIQQLKDEFVLQAALLPGRVVTIEA